MKPFSLINSLQTNRPAPEVAKVEAPQYAVYILETAGNAERLAVPVSNVESFDLYLTENIDALSDIDALLAKFEAVRFEA